jgi:hypothetical protein
MRRFLTAALVGLVPLGSLAALTWASPASNVTPTPIARGTFPAFNVRSDPHGPVDFRAHASQPVDIFVRQHDYAPGGQTGWHSHPGPVFLTVTKGELTVYEYDDPDCKAVAVHEGEGYVDTGRGHLVRNESGAPAQDVSVIMAPINKGAFRGELPAPNPNCGF